MVNREIFVILQAIAGELKNDIMSLKSLSKIASFKSSFLNLTPKDIVPTDETEILPLLTETIDVERPFEDLRIKQLTFRYFRTFPDAGGKPYGVNFMREECSCSTFLVGKNGTGKSTIFDAIEYYYTNKVSNAEQKSIWENIEYLTFGFGRIPEITSDKVLLGVKTQKEIQEVDLKGHSPLCQSTPFCSEKDIIDICYLPYGNLYEYIFEQLGYSELLKLQSRLVEIKNEILQFTQSDNKADVYLKGEDVEIVIEAFLKYYKSKKKDIVIKECQCYFKTNWDIVHKKTKLSHNKDEQSPRMFVDQWKRLRKIVKDDDVVTRFSNTKALQMFKKLQLMYMLLEETLKANSAAKAFYLFANQLNQSKQQEAEKVAIQERRMDYTKGLETITKINHFLISVIDNIIEKFVAEYQEFIERCLSYFSEENETFKLRYYKGEHRVVIDINVKKDEGSFLTNPYEYLNSFRFKLYAIALKVSLAFRYMQMNRRILPIAIDDVFNANDFDNCGRLQQFVHSVYQLFYEKVCKEIPLQVILLTHDEMILSAFRKGFNFREICRWNESLEQRKLSYDAYQLYSGNCIVGRLFHYGEARSMYNKTHKGYLYDEILNLYNALN